METIRHYASFPATGVSLRQMVQFGDRPSTGEFILCSREYSSFSPGLLLAMADLMSSAK